jgi:hypothetical protein
VIEPDAGAGVGDALEIVVAETSAAVAVEEQPDRDAVERFRAASEAFSSARIDASSSAARASSASVRVSGRGAVTGAAAAAGRVDGRAAPRCSGGRCPGREVQPRDRLAMIWEGHPTVIDRARRASHARGA